MLALPASALAQSRPPKPPQPNFDEGRLPPQARDMILRIRDAIGTGDINRLRITIERNETPPIFERGAKGHGVDILKRRSADGQGKEMLHLLRRTLDSGFMIQAAAAAPEQMIWPWFARLAPARFDAAMRAQAWGLVRVADIGMSVQSGQPLFHRLGIGADGTWHYFFAG